MSSQLAEVQPSQPHRVISAPHRRAQMLEQGVLLEFGAFLAASPLLRLVGRGDHHPVLVMPGFFGDDASTLPLRSHIRSWGYWAHGVHGGQNLGPTPRVLAAIQKRLAAIHTRHGRRVSLVGWSAGGLFARYLAREHPDIVRQVITLGTPLQMRAGDRSSISSVTDLFEPGFDKDFRALADHERGPLPVPSTSIYSRTDGVVRWHACLDVVDDRHENVEVRASHSGFGINPSALAVVANRLAQPEEQWRPFQPPVWLRPLYPRSPSWRERT